MSEQGASLAIAVIIAILFGPLYLGLLIIGYRNRKRLVIHPLAKWFYAASLPVALLCVSLISVYGTDEINTTSDAGRLLNNMASTALVLGLISVFAVTVQTIKSHRKNKAKTP